MAAWIAARFKRYPLVGYVALAYALTWLIVAPLVAVAQGRLALPVPFSRQYLAQFGPMVAALLMTRLIDGPAGLRTLVWRLGHRLAGGALWPGRRDHPPAERRVARPAARG